MRVNPQRTKTLRNRRAWTRYRCQYAVAFAVKGIPDLAGAGGPWLLRGWQFVVESAFLNAREQESAYHLRFDFRLADGSGNSSAIAKATELSG